MADENALSILDKLPRKTPVWAIGLVSVIVSASISFVVIYTAARPEVQQYVSGNQKNEERRLDGQAGLVQHVFDLLKIDSEQIAGLTVRVSILEKDLSESKDALSNCEKSLKVCKR